MKENSQISKPAQSREGEMWNDITVPRKTLILYTRSGCIEHWTAIFKLPPPKYLSIQLMRKALAFDAQIKRNGSHSPAVRRALKQALKIHLTSKTVKAGTPIPLPLLRVGTHLLREWNGRTYQVEVLEGGFLLDGKEYRSLSSVAQKITGTHWSGPRFFGLRSQKPSQDAQA